jgi:hypothetical protein
MKRCGRTADQSTRAQQLIKPSTARCSSLRRAHGMRRPNESPKTRCWRVRFAPINGHHQAVSACPKRANIVARVESCNGLNFWRKLGARRSIIRVAFWSFLLRRNSAHDMSGSSCCQRLTLCARGRHPRLFDHLVSRGQQRGRHR